MKSLKSKGRKFSGMKGEVYILGWGDLVRDIRTLLMDLNDVDGFLVAV
jgi:hypothetical protein